MEETRIGGTWHGGRFGDLETGEVFSEEEVKDWFEAATEQVAEEPSEP